MDDHDERDDIGMTIVHTFDFCLYYLKIIKANNATYFNSSEEDPLLIASTLRQA